MTDRGRYSKIYRERRKRTRELRGKRTLADLVVGEPKRRRDEVAHVGDPTLWCWELC